MKIWSKNDEEILIKLLKVGLSYDKISLKLDRTSRSVKEKTHKLGYKYNSFINNKIIKCLNCDKEFEVSLRNKRELERKFCNNSCSSSFNNKNRGNNIKDKISKTMKENFLKIKSNCIVCGKIVKRNNKYCSCKCSVEDRYLKYIQKWKENENRYEGQRISSHIRKYLFEKYDNKCSMCGWGKLNEYSGRVPLEVEHIDGDSSNNKEENLTLLCPNCHSLTKSYKGANRGNGRYSRMKRYYDGKSY